MHKKETRAQGESCNYAPTALEENIFLDQLSCYYDKKTDVMVFTPEKLELFFNGVVCVPPRCS